MMHKRNEKKEGRKEGRKKGRKERKKKKYNDDIYHYTLYTYIIRTLSYT